MRRKPQARPNGSRKAGEPVQHAEPPPAKLMAVIDDSYRWCATCSRSAKPVAVVATELGHTTIICRECVRQLGGLWT